MKNFLETASLDENHDLDGEWLAAGLRHTPHVAEAARIGADTGTTPHEVFQQLVEHPLPDIGLERFLADSEKAERELGAKAGRR